MTTTPPSVRLARKEDIPALAQVMTRAFAQDPFFSWFAGPGPGAPERMRTGWNGLLRHASASLSATYTTADLAGAAMWIPPGGKASTTVDSLRLTPTLIRLTGWSRLREVAAILELMESRRHHHLAAPHAYLSALGVDQGRQGQGIGTALVRPMLDRCDREGIPAYLETATARNVVLYERLGFETVEQLTLPGTDVSGWLMIRHPDVTTAA